jgi:hypothetical protein
MRAMLEVGCGAGKEERRARWIPHCGSRTTYDFECGFDMPPEELPKLYEPLFLVGCEFANGCRLVYPMDKKAMRFLNFCASKMFSWILGQSVKDTLCGTKVLTRQSFDQIAANPSYFRDFDPFSDFALLFWAAKLNLKILDLPARYKERVYGPTFNARSLASCFCRWLCFLLSS